MPEFAEELTTEEQAVLDNDQAAEAVVEPEPVSEPEPVAEPEEREPTQVPYGVLREERDKRQALEGEVAVSRENVRRLEGMFTQLMDKMGQTPEPEAQAPDWNEDPDAYTRHVLDKMESRLGNMEQGQQQTVQQQTQTAQETQFVEAFRSAARQFTQTKPDFQDAYNHVVSTLNEELTHRGFTDPVQREQIIRQEEKAIVERAFHAGKNPAEVIYDYAGYRGYKPASSNGEDKLATIAAGQAASSALPAAAAGTEAGVSMARLEEAEGDEFDKLFDEAQRKGLLG